MLGLSGLGQSALGALPPNGTLPLSSYCPGTIVINRQEQPWHPASLFFAGVRASNTAPPGAIKTNLFNVQEIPGHPRPSFNPGIQGPNVRPPVADSLITRQEMPWHPLPRMWAGLQQIGNVGLTPEIVPRVFVVQEMPWHPRPLMFSAPPPTPKSIAKYQFFNSQQQPWHPNSMFFAGHFPVDYEDIQVLIIF